MHHSFLRWKTETLAFLKRRAQWGESLHWLMVLALSEPFLLAQWLKKKLWSTDGVKLSRWTLRNEPLSETFQILFWILKRWKPKWGDPKLAFLPLSPAPEPQKPLCGPRSHSIDVLTDVRGGDWPSKAHLGNLWEASAIVMKYGDGTISSSFASSWLWKTLTSFLNHGKKRKKNRKEVCHYQTQEKIRGEKKIWVEVQMSQTSVALGCCMGSLPTFEPQFCL